MQENRDQLKNEFVTRTAANPRYSLRAFARDLEISPSLLCEVLSGKKNLSKTSVNRIAALLGWNRNPIEKHDANLIAGISWLHLAIVEMCRYEKIKHSSAILSELFSIPESVAKYAMELLLEKKYLISKNGYLSTTTKRMFFGSDTPSSEIRRYHREFMDLAKRQVEVGHYNERELSSSLWYLTPSQVQTLRRKIRLFVEAAAKQNASTDGDGDVFGFSLQLFKVTKNNNPKKNRGET